MRLKLLLAALLLASVPVVRGDKTISTLADGRTTTGATSAIYAAVSPPETGARIGSFRFTLSEARRRGLKSRSTVARLGRPSGNRFSVRTT